MKGAAGVGSAECHPCAKPSTRHVIAFPKTAKGIDLMMDSPSVAAARQWRDLPIEVTAAKKQSTAFGWTADHLLSDTDAGRGD